MPEITRVGASFRNYFFDAFPQAAIFCNSVAQEFKIPTNIVHEALLSEVHVANKVGRLEEPDVIDEFAVNTALGFCKSVLENGAYIHMFENLEELLRSINMFRRSALFFSFLHQVRDKERSLIVNLLI